MTVGSAPANVSPDRGPKAEGNKVSLQARNVINVNIAFLGSASRASGERDEVW